MSTITSNIPPRKRAAMLQAIGGYVNTSISIIQGLILIPLYVHYIGAHTYGLWLATGGILAWLGFVDMGLSGVFIQRIASAYSQQNLVGVAAYFTNGIALSFCMSIVFVGLGLIVSLWLSDLLGAGEQGNLLQHCFQLAMLATGLNIVSEFLRAFPQALLRPIHVIISLIASRLLGLIVTIVLIFHDYGLWSIPLGMMMTAMSVFILNSITAARLFHRLGIKASINMGVLREYMSISPALFAGRMGNAMVLQIEPLLIAMIIRPELATAYVVTKRAADIFSQLLQVIVAAIYPAFSHLVGEADLEKIGQAMRDIIRLIFTLGLVGLASYVAMNQSFISLWVGTKYSLDYHVVILIAAGVLVMTLRNAISRMLMGMGDIVKPSLLMLLEAVFRIGIMAILLKTMGIVGVPVGLLLSCGIFLIVFVVRVNIKLPLVIAHRALAKAALVSLVAFGVALVLMDIMPSPDTWWAFIIYTLIVSTVFLVGAIYLSPSLRRIAVQSLVRI